MSPTTSAPNLSTPQPEPVGQGGDAAAFSRRLLAWYATNGRTLPWRGIADPYRIWISEIILQQTQVRQGRDYYLRFISRFPDVAALACASEDDVLRQWQGLGYYSRARNLHAAARQIVERGAFPSSYADIRQLKGVGEYTAAAIASFAFGLPVATVDGNVYRVLARHFGVPLPIDTTEGRRYFRQLAEALLDRRHPADHNQALMDFGATVCTPRAPRCADCPFADSCAARAEGLVGQLPCKAKATAVRTRHFVYLYVRLGHHILLHQRAAGDIWQGLYEPPLLEFDHQPALDEVLRRASLPATAVLQPVVQGLKHVLTHRVLLADAYLVELPADAPYALADCRFVPETERDRYAVPRLVEKIFAQFPLLTASEQ